MESNSSCNQFGAAFGTLEAILCVNIITLIIISCLWSFVVLYSLCLIKEKTKLREGPVALPSRHPPSVSSFNGLSNVVKKLSTQYNPQTAGYMTIANRNIIPDSEVREFQGNVEATNIFVDTESSNIIINKDVINIENVTD